MKSILITFLVFASICLGVFAVGTIGDKCWSNDDCESDLKCWQNMCIPNENRMKNHRCYPPCNAHTNCGIFDVCVNGCCQPPSRGKRQEGFPCKTNRDCDFVGYCGHDGYCHID